jgi:hypothetical protein
MVSATSAISAISATHLGEASPFPQSSPKKGLAQLAQLALPVSAFARLRLPKAVGARISGISGIPAGPFARPLTPEPGQDRVDLP